MTKAHINYHLSGNGSKTITFIHGLGGNLHHFAAQISFLEKHYQVLAIDLLGFGESDKPLDKKYDNAHWAKNIAQLLKELNINKTVIVGHSAGGRVAIYFAAHYPETTQALITLSTTDWHSDHRRADDCDALAQTTRETGMQAAIDHLTQYPADLISADVQTQIYSAFEKSDPEIFARGLESVANDLRNTNAVKFTRTITCPTLHIRGDQDLAPLAATEHLTQVIANSKMHEIKDCWHYCMLEKPDEVNQLILTFVDELK